MSITLRIFSGFFLAIILLFLFYMIRRGTIRAKYSLIWCGICLVLIAFDIFPEFLFSLAPLFGISDPVNLFLAGMLVLLICVSIHFSVVLSRVENRLQDLTEDFALLREQFSDLENIDSDSD
jgi:hypothetical protein